MFDSNSFVYTRISGVFLPVTRIQIRSGLFINLFFVDGFEFAKTIDVAFSGPLRGFGLVVHHIPVCVYTRGSG